MTEEKLERMKQMQASQDGHDLNRLEQNLAHQKQQEKTDDDGLVNPEKVKQALMDTIKGIEFEQRQLEDGRLVEVPVQNEEKALGNKHAHDFADRQFDSYVTSNISGGYWKGSQIEKVMKEIIFVVVTNCFKKRKKFGFEDTEEADEFANIILVVSYATISKARGGRALKHDEQTRIEKTVRSLTGADNDEDDGLTDSALRGVF